MTIWDYIVTGFGIGSAILAGCIPAAIGIAVVTAAASSAANAKKKD